MFCCMNGGGQRRRDNNDSGCRRVRMLVVGDGQCGKTSLIQQYCSGTLPADYSPTLFDTNTVNTIVDDRKVQLVIQDTTSQEDLDRLRPPFYLNTDVVVVCFSLDQPGSLQHVQHAWIPEARRYCHRKVPILLVANKADVVLRKAGASGRSGSHSGGSAPAVVPAYPGAGGDARRPDSRKAFPGLRRMESEGRALAGRLGAVGYRVSSAVMNVGVGEVFEAALEAAVSSKAWKKKYKS